MKSSRILALILAIICCISMLVACDVDGGDEDNGKLPETPKECYVYAHNYLISHAYKQTTVSTSTINGETSVSEEVSYIDGENYYLINGEISATFYDGTMYVQSPSGKKKMDIDIESAGDIEMVEDYLKQIEDSFTDEDIKMTKNDDGTITLELVMDIPFAGPYDYVLTLDKHMHIVEYTLSCTLTVSGHVMTSTDEISIEYGDQYKVSPPEDADDYVVVDSYYDLVT